MHLSHFTVKVTKAGFPCAAAFLRNRLLFGGSGVPTLRHQRDRAQSNQTQTTNMKIALLLLLSIVGLALICAELRTEDQHTEEADVVAVDDAAGLMRRGSRSRRRKSKGQEPVCSLNEVDAECSGPTSLKATFEAAGIKATVKVTQSIPDLKEKRAKWTATFTEFTEADLCPGGQLNWHVHQTSGNGLGAACGSSVTGGHYDPMFACGGASNNNGVGQDASLGFPKGVCSFMADNAGRDYALRCTPSTQNLCEIGDQSGKMGKLDATSLGTQQKSTDLFMGDIRNLAGRSLVLHCCISPGSCSARIACADLE